MACLIKYVNEVGIRNPSLAFADCINRPSLLCLCLCRHVKVATCECVYSSVGRLPGAIPLQWGPKWFVGRNQQV